MRAENLAELLATDYSLRYFGAVVQTLNPM
jgi:hypothetical protein